MSQTSLHAPVRTHFRLGIGGLVLAVIVFAIFQLFPTEGVLVQPFSNLRFGMPLGFVSVLLTGALFAVSFWLIATTRVRGIIAAVLALLAWIGGLWLHENLKFAGLDFAYAPVGIGFVLVIAIPLSLAWLIARSVRPLGWLSLVLLVLIPIIWAPVMSAEAQVSYNNLALQRSPQGAILLGNLTDLLELLLLVMLPVALVVIASVLLSRVSAPQKPR